MWIVTTVGFFSVVQKPGDAGLTVRARARGDLDALRARYLPGLTEPSPHRGTDYPWRAQIARAAFAAALSQMALDIDYANFKDAVALRQGPARAHTYADVCKAMLAVEGLPPPTDPKASAARGARRARGRSGKWLAYGGLVLDAAGRVLVREPTGHFGGYVWTFPKGRPEPGETPEQTALREVREETGVEARITATMEQWFTGDASDTRFFVMEPVADHGDFDRAETAQVRWVALDESEALIRQTHSRRGRARDLAVLAALRAHLGSDSWAS